MQEVKLLVTVVFRSDGKPSKSDIFKNVCEAILVLDRPTLFGHGSATYAGYTVSVLDEKKGVKHGND